MKTGFPILTILICADILQDVEIVPYRSCLQKSDGMISAAAEALKLRRTTLIEK